MLKSEKLVVTSHQRKKKLQKDESITGNDEIKKITSKQRQISWNWFVWWMTHVEANAEH